jgi:CBS domain-containing protein
MAMSEEDFREIKSCMTKKVATITEDANILAAAKMMSDNSISCVIVVKAKKPVGIITERDLIKRVIVKREDPGKIKVKDVMTAPVLSVPPESDLVPTGELMKKKKVRRFPVTNDKGELIGLVTQTDILEGIIKLVKHIDWKLVTMKISVEEYIEKLKDSRIL